MVKRTAADKHFSNCIRERANWTCEACGNHFPPGNTRGLDCSHLFTRARKSVRHHPLNAVAHCTSCHFRLGGNPVEFAEWREKYLTKHYGPGVAEEMVQIANRTRSMGKAKEKDISAYLRTELKRMQELRKDGVTGRIEFGVPPHLEDVGENNYAFRETLNAEDCPGNQENEGER